MREVSVGNRSSVATSRSQSIPPRSRFARQRPERQEVALPHEDASGPGKASAAVSALRALPEARLGGGTGCVLLTAHMETREATRMNKSWITEVIAIAIVVWLLLALTDVAFATDFPPGTPTGNLASTSADLSTSAWAQSRHLRIWRLKARVGQRTEIDGAWRGLMCTGLIAIAKSFPDCWFLRAACAGRSRMLTGVDS
jgi:hypothetical protein